MGLFEIMEDWVAKKTGYTKVKMIVYSAGDYRFKGLSPDGELEIKVYCSHDDVLKDKLCGISYNSGYAKDLGGKK